MYTTCPQCQPVGVSGCVCMYAACLWCVVSVEQGCEVGGAPRLRGESMNSKPILGNVVSPELMCANTNAVPSGTDVRSLDAQVAVPVAGEHTRGCTYICGYRLSTQQRDSNTEPSTGRMCTEIAPKVCLLTSARFETRRKLLVADHETVVVRGGVTGATYGAERRVQLDVEREALEVGSSATERR